MRCRTCRFLHVGAAYHCTCSMRQWNSYDFRIQLWSTHKCGRMLFGCADWRKNCSRSHNSCCAKRSHSLSRRSSDRNQCAGADWTNTAPTNHSCSCGRLHRWFRSWSDRRRRNTTGNRCWYRWQPAHSEESMYGCRIPGRCPTHKHRIRDFWWCMFLNIGRNDTRCIRCNLRGRVTNVRLQRTRLGMNIFHSLGSCR